MSILCLAKHLSRVLGIFILALLSLGCPKKLPKVDPPQPGVGEGEIYVSSPRAYSRERLILDREMHRRWLETQLTRPDSDFDAFQFRTQTRTLSRSSSSFGVDATATGALGIDQAEAQAEDLGRAQQIADLEHQIRVAQLQSDLEKARKGELTITMEASVATSGTDPSSDSTGGDSGGSDSSSSSGNPSADDAGSVSFPSAAVPATAVTGTPIDRFYERLAYRDAVREELLNNNLDDAHDLNGNTLYRLAFDATILPSGANSRWALINVAVSKGSECDLKDPNEVRRLQLFLYEFTEAFKQAIQAETNDILQTMSMPTSEVTRAQPEISYLFDQNSELRTLRQKISSGKSTREQAEQEVFGLVLKRYQKSIRSQSLETYLKLEEAIEEPERRSINLRWVPEAPDSKVPDDVTAFCELLAKLPDTVSAYAVTPRESVERIADLFAGRSERQQALSLALSLGTVGIKSGLQQLEALESQREAVRRQPLVVGHMGDLGSKANDASADSFGWIIGPRVTPRHGGPGFDVRHRASGVVLSAVVSAPAWWTSAKVQVCTSWSKVCKDTDDQKCSEGGLPEAETTLRCTEDNRQTVRLPGDPAEIVRVLFPRTRRPRPFFYNQTPRLEAGRKEKLVIHGSNLWRNPQVLLGKQAASDVQILPDMKGLVATFNKVQEPAGWLAGKQPLEVDAWVVTSEGAASAGVVELYKPKKRPPEKVEVPFSIKSVDPEQKIVNNRGSGSLQLEFKFEQKKVNGAMKNIVDRLILKVDASLHQSSSGPCLDQTKNPWQIKESCTVTLDLFNLRPGQIVTVTAWDKDDKAKKKHPPLEFRVQ